METPTVIKALFLAVLAVNFVCSVAVPRFRDSGHAPWQSRVNNLNKFNKGFTEPQQTWNYVDVRTHAHMFWWLYYTTAPEGFRNKPLVLWLQGGPGGSSTGFGNFEEIGPLDVNLQPRDTTWLSEASLLFIDNPVGTGYSYVTSDDAYSTDGDMIANDLVKVMQAFMQNVTDFETIPFYIFSESYGGKMTAVFSQALLKAIQSASIKCDFRGFAMGDSWISPVDSVLTWGPYLYATSLVDKEGLAVINATAMASKAAFDAGDYAKSTALWGQTEDVINLTTAGVNVYNILKWQPSDFTLRFKPRNKGPNDKILGRMFDRLVRPLQQDPLDQLMNGEIRQKLGIIPENVTWGGQSGKVFEKLNVDFMKPVIDSVDDLLQNSQLKVVVYSGQLDLIVDTLGTEIWVQKLKWPSLPEYNNATRKPVLDEKGVQPLYFVKSYGNFSFYWILDSGHMVPQDAGVAALKMLHQVLTGEM